MKLKALGVCVAFLVPVACGNAEDPDVQALDPQAITAAAVYKIGVLVDNASPAKANFTAAANLARSQINQGLSQAGINRQFTLVIANYTAGQARATAINLVNTQGVLGIVADTDESAAEVNQLNYDGVPAIVRNVPVTCYQCSSPRFNSPEGAAGGPTDAGYVDDQNWLFRTFFNAKFELPVQARILLDRTNGGDFNGDGHVKVVIYHDIDHEDVVGSFQSVLDSMHQGPHTVKGVVRGPGGGDINDVFDSEPDGHFPDAVHLSFSTAALPGALNEYKHHPIPRPRPPVSTNDNGRRDFLLPTLLAAGGEGLHGSSILRVDSSASGTLFKSAFESATGKQPEVTSSFVYDSVAAQAIAIGWADSFGSTDPGSIAANFRNINEPGERVIRPKVADFKVAAQRIKQQEPINYEGASSPLDFDFIEFAGVGENYPDLVHWKIQNGKFVELERYRCDPALSEDPSIPSCTRR